MQLIAPKFWQKKSFLSLLLWPIGYLYGLIGAICRNRIEYYPSAKIITIGNITIGGAGKTPVAISLTKITDKKIAILTRGYLGRLKGPLIVESSHNVFDVGDEALLLSKHATTCVAKDRLAGIKFLESLGYEFIITDDGLQDNRFAKALSILVVDSYYGFGNGFVFPAGPLRESLSSGFKKADFIALIGDSQCSLPNLPILKAKLISSNQLTGQNFIAFAGIGNPDKFFHSVTESGGNIIKKVAFGDHHQYTDDELQELVALASIHKAKLITTEKDYTRVNAEFKSKIQTLPVELIWQDIHKIKKYLKEL